MKALKNKRKDYGLCGFEYDKTISGNIEKRKSYHIHFDKSPPREENINKVWYSKDYEYDDIKPTIQKSGLEKKIHPFKSDFPHKVFAPKRTLPQFYDIEKPDRLVRQRSDINVRQM